MTSCLNVTVTDRPIRSDGNGTPWNFKRRRTERIELLQKWMEIFGTILESGHKKTWTVK